MSTPSPILVAAAPSLIAVVQALQTFFTSLGTDPTQIPLRLDGAAKVLLGTIELQLPALAGSEIGAIQTEINGKLAGYITQLQAIK